MVLIPLKDNNPLRHIYFQYVTVGIIIICAGVFLWQTSLGLEGGQRAILGLGTIPSVLFHIKQLPSELAAIPAELTVLTSMFMHASFMHLFGNMLFLWVLGDNIEDAMGHFRFFFFYIFCGISAVMTHALINPQSELPMIGASGAVSGVIGAYLVLHPRAMILTLVFRFMVHLPAYVVLGMWIAFQLFNASLAPGTEGGGVAWFAHIGGFAAGVIMIFPLRRSGAWHRRSLIPNSGQQRRNHD